MTQDEINAVKKAAEKMRKQESAQDEIIEIFKGVGIPHHLIEFYKQELIDAANLVAQKVRDRIMFGSRDDWVLAEREACAKVCDELHWPWRIGDNSGPKQCAIAIRARGEA